MRKVTEDKYLTHRKTLKLRRLRKLLSCSYCKPNKNENGKKGNQYRKKNQSWKFKTKKTKISKQYEI